MTRLHTRIYLHVLAVLLVVGLTTSALFSFGQRGALLREVTQRLARHLASQLSDAPALAGGSGRPLTSDPGRLRVAIDQLHRDFEIDLSVCDLHGTPLAVAGRALPAPAPDELLALSRGQDVYQRRATAAAAPIRDPQNGAILGILQMSPPRRMYVGGSSWLWRPLLSVALVLIVVAAASRPLARRISRPVEQLTEASRRLGAGDLSYRIAVPPRCPPFASGGLGPPAAPDPDDGDTPPPHGHGRRWARRMRTRHRAMHAMHDHMHRAHGHPPVDELVELMHAWNDMADRIERLLRGQRELLANISHELRSPLARVRLALELLPREESSEARFREVEADLSELDRLIEDVLITSRLQATGLPSHPQKQPLLPLLQQVVERAQNHPHTADKDIQIDVADDARTAADLQVYADGTLLKRALGNLVENAGKYGAPPIVVRARMLPDATEITVCDHGVGIAPADRERVLEPFYRADRAHTPSAVGASRGDKQGFGLGLTLAKRVAEAHGGRIAIGPAHVTPATATTPAVETGCCITLHLPLRQSPPSA